MLETQFGTDTRGESRPHRHTILSSRPIALSPSRPLALLLSCPLFSPSRHPAALSPSRPLILFGSRLLAFSPSLSRYLLPILPICHFTISSPSYHLPSPS